MNALVILNPASGTLSIPAQREGLLAALRDAGLDTTVVTVAKGGEIAAAVRPHLQSGCQTVVAAGGDGTVSAVAAMLAGTGRNLGVIPGGTLNHFAKDMNIPLDLTRAVQVIRAGITRRVDVGVVNGRPFLNNSSLGLYPEMVMKREEIRRRGFRKATALLAAGALTLMRFPLFRVRLELNGQAITRLTPFVFVGNNPYLVDPVHFGMRPRIDTGQLCIWVARRSRRLGLLRAVSQVAFRGFRGVRELDVFTTGQAAIQPHRPLVPVSIDGEVFELRAPLQYEIRPGALSVFAPSAGEPR